MSIIRQGILIVILLGWCFLGYGQAEQVYLVWREPTASGTLAFTTAYWCLGTPCSVWQMAPRCDMSNANGGGLKKIRLDIPLNQSQVPVTLRLKVTATDTRNNETTGVVTTHTFAAP